MRYNITALNFCGFAAKESHSHLPVLPRYEQAFINSLLQKTTGKETLYYWIGLQDTNNTGEYQWVSKDGSVDVANYTNWGWFEPGRTIYSSCSIKNLVQK